MAGVPSVPKSKTPPVQPKDAAEPVAKKEAAAPKTGDGYDAGKVAATSAPAKEADAQVKSTLTTWQKLRGDAPRTLAGTDLKNEVGAALGLAPNNIPKTAEDEQKLTAGSWPYFNGTSGKAVDTIAAAITKAGGQTDSATVGVMPFAFQAEGSTESKLMPLFRVDSSQGQRFVDPDGRTYSSFDAWTQQNALRPGTFTFPKNGLLSAPGDQGLNELVTQNTPAVIDTASERLLDVGDKAAIAGGLVLGGMAIVGSGGTLIPVVGGAALSAYSMGRAGAGLYDLAEHGQSLSPLANPQARSQWMGLVANGVGLGALGASVRAASSVANTGKLAPGLASMAPALNVASAATGSAMFVDQGVNLATHWSQMKPQERMLALSQMAFFGGGMWRQAQAMGGVPNLYSLEANTRAFLPHDANLTVIGSGLSGAAAAKRAADEGLTVNVLEARDRTGGRASYGDDGLGKTWDRGPQWVHSYDESPLGARAKAAGIKLDETNLNGAFFIGNRKATKKEQNQFWETQIAQDEQIKALAETGDVRGDKGVDMSLPFAQESMKTLGESLLGVPLSWASGKDYAHHTMTLKDGLPEGGMGGAIYGMVAGPARPEIKTSLNTPVTAIKRGPDGVEVTTANGNTIHSDSVVVTVPTGVLRAKPGELGAIQFDPPLPAKTQAAINDLPMGSFEKVALRFDRNVFGKNVNQWQTHAANDGSGDAQWFLINPAAGDNMAINYVGGKEGATLPKNPEAFVEYAMSGLRNMYGPKVDKALIAAEPTNWAADPYARGSYSYAKPGRSDARKDLAEPVDNQLWFAGEAVGPDGWAITATGAVLSGEKAASEAVHVIRAQEPAAGPPRLSRDQLGVRAKRPAEALIGLGTSELDEDDSE